MKIRIPKLSKETKIYLLIALIIFLWISFLPQISTFIDKLFSLK